MLFVRPVLLAVAISGLALAGNELTSPADLKAQAESPSQG